MRRIGIGLMIVGLAGILIGSWLGETAGDSTARRLIELLFYGAIGMCILGAAVFSLRVFLARR